MINYLLYYDHDRHIYIYIIIYLHGPISSNLHRQGYLLFHFGSAPLLDDVAEGTKGTSAPEFVQLKFP